MALSQDALVKTQGVLEACDEPDDGCFQEVYQVLRDTHLEIDSRLDRRGFSKILLKTFKSTKVAVASLAMLLVAMWAVDSGAQQPNIVYVPIEIASQAPKLAEPTAVVISADGTPVVTVTPTPDPTGLRG